jgi:hypothetical protein
MPKLVVFTSYTPNFTDNFIVQNISESVKRKKVEKEEARSRWK